MGFKRVVPANPNGGRDQGVYLSQKGRVLYLSRAAMALMGEARRIAIFLDEEDGQILIREARQGEPAFSVPHSEKAGGSTGVFSAVALSRFIDERTGGERTRVYGEWDDTHNGLMFTLEKERS